MKVFPDIDKDKLDQFYIRVGKNVRVCKAKNISQLELAISIGHNNLYIAKKFTIGNFFYS